MHFQPIVTNIDWLSYSVNLIQTDAERLGGVLFTPPHGYILKYFDGGTNLYKHRAILFSQEGDKVLTLLWQPHSNIINPNSMFVEVANRLLYCDMLYKVPTLVDALHMNVFTSLSRLDLATDFNPTAEQYNIIARLNDGTAYAQGKREGAQFHDYQQGKNIERVPRQLSWGSKASNIKWKLYNKTKEITEIDPKGRTWCNKPYIKNMWLQNGIDANRDVWRLEVSIMSASTHQWRGEKLAWAITDPGEFTLLFYDLLATRFVIRANEGHDNKRYDHILDFLPIPTTEHYRLRRTDPQTEQHHTDHAATLRNLMKELDRPETQCNHTIANTLLHTLGSVISSAKLEAYFHRATGKTWDDWREEYEKNLPY